MTQTYPKPWKSYQEQLDQLIARGMSVTDNAKALDYLERIGYYRLSGYWFAFRERTELCCPLDPHSGKSPRRSNKIGYRSTTFAQVQPSRTLSTYTYSIRNCGCSCWMHWNALK